MTESLPPGTLRLVRGRPNGDGAGRPECYLVVGDATAGPVRQILPEPGLTVPAAPSLAAGRSFRLHILHFNDLHGHLAAVDVAECRPVFSRLVRRIRELRQRCQDDPGTGLLVFSGGDDLVGGAFSELWVAGAEEAPEAAGKARPFAADGRVHAAYRLYSAAGVDAGAVGNHDLDLGLPDLVAAAAADARFPLLSANLVAEPGPNEFHHETRAPRRSPTAVAWGLHPGFGTEAGTTQPPARTAIPPICPAAIFVLEGVRVGVVGLTTPAQLSRRPGRGFRVTDPIGAIRNLLPAFRPLCDVLIVLSHLGHSLAMTSALVEGAGDVELARSLPPGGVHLILGAHTHDALNESGLRIENLVNGIPIAQAGANGRFLGEVQLLVQGVAGGRLAAAVTGARLLPTADLPADEGFEAEHVAPLARRVQRALAQPVGRVGEHPDLGAQRVAEGFARDESALANYLTDALVERCRMAGHPVDFAMLDASTVSGGLPAGKCLVYGDLFRLMPYADTIRVYELDVSQLAQLLDDNARRADRPDEPHVERGFSHFSRAVRYTVAQGARRWEARALNITVGEVPLDRLRGHRFKMACSSSLRLLAAGWERHASEVGVEPFALASLPCVDTGLGLRREIVAYAREHGGVTEEAGLRRDGRLTYGHSRVLC